MLTDFEVIPDETVAVEDKIILCRDRKRYVFTRVTEEAWEEIGVDFGLYYGDAARKKAVDLAQKNLELFSRLINELYAARREPPRVITITAQDIKKIASEFRK